MNGLAVAIPTACVPAKKSTRMTVPSTSPAVALIAICAGAVKAAFEGAEMATVGTTLLLVGVLIATLLNVAVAVAWGL